MQLETPLSKAPLTSMRSPMMSPAPTTSQTTKKKVHLTASMASHPTLQAHSMPSTSKKMKQISTTKSTLLPPYGPTTKTESVLKPKSRGLVLQLSSPPLPCLLLPSSFDQLEPKLSYFQVYLLRTLATSSLVNSILSYA